MTCGSVQGRLMPAMSDPRPDAGTQSSALPEHTPEVSLTQRTLPSDSAVVERHRDAVWAIQGAEHFDIQEAIASGGQGTVFRARHRESGEIVALKVFHQSGIDSQRALKEEFRSLATLRHPGIVRMYELHIGEDHAFFTMEYVEGSELDAYLRSVLPASESAAQSQAQGERYWSALRLTITQLAIAIDAAHNAGLLHLDIKPGNVRVTESGRVVLLDFGLVRHARQRAGQAARAGGTPPYMAPEQLCGNSVSEKTDWYALGAVVLQLLHGEPSSRRAAHRQASAAPQLRAAEPPRDLALLCEALFQYQPDARPSGREVLARLGALTPRSNINAAAAEGLVGRAAELGTLDELLEAYRSGSARGTTVVKVSGRPGAGKTHLLRSFVDRAAREQHAHVFSGRCFPRALVPYRLLDELMDPLAEARRP